MAQSAPLVCLLISAPSSGVCPSPSSPPSGSQVADFTLRFSQSCKASDLCLAEALTLHLLCRGKDSHSPLPSNFDRLRSSQFSMLHPCFAQVTHPHSPWCQESELPCWDVPKCQLQEPFFLHQAQQDIRQMPPAPSQWVRYLPRYLQRQEMLSPTASAAGLRQLSHIWHKQGYSMNAEVQLCSRAQVKVAFWTTGILKMTLLAWGSKTLFGACVNVGAG